MCRVTYHRELLMLQSTLNILCNRINYRCETQSLLTNINGLSWEPTNVICIWQRFCHDMFSVIFLFLGFWVFSSGFCFAGCGPWWVGKWLEHACHTNAVSIAVSSLFHASSSCWTYLNPNPDLIALRSCSQHLINLFVPLCRQQGSVGGKTFTLFSVSYLDFLTHPPTPVTKLIGAGGAFFGTWNN